MSRKTIDTDAIDYMVAKKITELRLALGLSRMQVSKKIGVTHQQLSKYESGDNRITAGRLKVIAKALGKPISYFFGDDDINEVPTQHRRMSIEVSRNFMKIKDPTYQNAINFLTRTLAGNA